jgi:DNA-binding NarL/FixJ family response regulator
MSGVLIVDQSPAASAAIRAACEQAGLHVVGVAADGLAAIEMVRAMAPTIVTIDLVLPRLSGLQVLEALARLGLEPRVVVISAVRAREPIVAARAAGARAYLLKPVIPTKLAAILDEAYPSTPASAVARRCP